MIKELTYHLNNILVAFYHSFFCHVQAFYMFVVSITMFIFSITLNFSIFSFFFSIVFKLSTTFKIFVMIFFPIVLLVSIMFILFIMFIYLCHFHFLSHVFFFACLLFVFFFQFVSIIITPLKLVLVQQLLCVFLCLWFEVESGALDVMGVLTKEFLAFNMKLMVKGWSSIFLSLHLRLHVH